MLRTHLLAVPPHPFDPARAVRVKEKLAEAGFSSGEPLLESVFGNSAFLGRMAVREAGALGEYFAAGPQTVLNAAILLAEAAGHADSEAQAMKELRVAKRRAALAIAMADIAGGKKRFLGVALSLGVLGSIGLGWHSTGGFIVASILFAIANLGFAAGNIFYEALLPHIARLNDLDRVSARGYAFGYLGGGLLLIINACWLLRPEWFFFQVVRARSARVLSASVFGG